MTNLKKSEKILLAVLLAAVIGYVYFQYLLSPTLSKIKDAQTSIDNYNSELRELKAMSAANKKLEASLNDLKGTVAKDSEAIPNISKTPQIQRDIKVIADGTKVSLSSIAFGNSAEFLQTVAPAGGTAANKANTASGSSTKGNTAAGGTASSRTMILPVTISISGDYDGIKNFVKALEDSKRISAVSDFAITPKTEKGSEGQVTTSIVANFFYFDDGKNEAASYDFNSGQYGKPEPFK